MAKAGSPKRRRTAKKEEETPDFESSLAKAEEILARLESGELGLTESLEQYEVGIRQLKRCHALLDAAEQRVTLLSGFDASGNPIEEPFHSPEDATAGRTSKSNDDQDESGGQRVDDVPGLF